MLAKIPEALAISQRTLTWFKGVIEQFRDEIRTFGNFPSMFMGLVTPQETGEHNALLEHYDGKLRFIDASGKIVADQIDPAKYSDYIAEVGRAVLLSEVAVFQIARLSGRHLPRRPAGAPQHHRPLRHAARPTRNGPNSALCAAASF